MSGYTKLFSSILASTIWREDDKTRIVWITLLAMTDRRGIAEGSVPGLADFARVSITDCENALLKLSSPDKHSRSKDKNGRRIEEVPGGWRIINHGAYRDKMNADERREYLRVKQQEFRLRLAKDREQRQHAVNNRKQPSTTVNPPKQRKHIHRSETIEQRAESIQTVKEQQSGVTNGNGAHAPGPVKELPDPAVKAFLVWFQEEYRKKRNGADYFVRWEKDGPLVKRLLKATKPDRLRLCAQILLSEKTDDHFIVQSDRGIGILSSKFNWLSDRLAKWEAQRAN